MWFKTIFLVMILFNILKTNGHTLSKIQLDNRADIYKVYEDEKTNTIQFTNPKSNLPTLREIIYYHIIEKPIYGSYETKNADDSDETTRPFTNAHSSPIENLFEDKLIQEGKNKDSEYVDDSSKSKNEQEILNSEDMESEETTDEQAVSKSAEEEDNKKTNDYQDELGDLGLTDIEQILNESKVKNKVNLLSQEKALQDPKEALEDPSEYSKKDSLKTENVKDQVEAAYSNSEDQNKNRENIEKETQSNIKGDDLSIKRNKLFGSPQQLNERLRKMRKSVKVPNANKRQKRDTEDLEKYLGQTEPEDKLDEDTKYRLINALAKIKLLLAKEKDSNKHAMESDKDKEVTTLTTRGNNAIMETKAKTYGMTLNFGEGDVWNDIINDNSSNDHLGEGAPALPSDTQEHLEFYHDEEYSDEDDIRREIIKRIQEIFSNFDKLQLNQTADTTASDDLATFESDKVTSESNVERIKEIDNVGVKTKSVENLELYSDDKIAEFIEELHQGSSYGMNLNDEEGFVWNNMFTKPGFEFHFGEEQKAKPADTENPTLDEHNKDLEDIYVNIHKEKKDNANDKEDLILLNKDKINVRRHHIIDKNNDKKEQFWKWITEWTTAYTELLTNFIDNKINDAVLKVKEKLTKANNTVTIPEDTIEKVNVAEKQEIIELTEGITEEATLKDTNLLRKHKDKEDNRRKPNNKPEYEIHANKEVTPKATANVIYGNAVGNREVTNIFVFLSEKNASKLNLLQNLKPLIDDVNLNNVTETIEKTKHEIVTSTEKENLILITEELSAENNNTTHSDTSGTVIDKVVEMGSTTQSNNNGITEFIEPTKLLTKHLPK